MNERVRRILIFGTIVTGGTLLILFDLPLIIVLPAIIAIGAVLLILLGAIPISELKTILSSRLTRGKKKPAADTGAQKTAAKAPAAQVAPRKEGSRFSLGSLFSRKAKKPSPAPAAAQKQQAVSGKRGLSLHASSFISSVKALGTILTTRKKPDPDKLKKIDNMLDLAVSGKVDATTPSSMTPHGKASSTAAANPEAGGGGGASTAPSGTPGEEDPFLSLSGDDLDAGLLDGLDDDDGLGTPMTGGRKSSGDAIPVPEDGVAMPTGDADIPVAPDDISAAADDILKASGETLTDDLPALEGLSSADGDLGDLDNISLDSVELDDDDEDADSVPQAPAPASAAEAPNLSMPAAAPSAAPSASSGRSDQQEMAAFAAASGGDDDMLSSLAAGIKSVKKEQDLSLLRDLKDFRAPGTKIETELTELFTTLNAATEKQKKRRASGKKAKPK